MNVQEFLDERGVREESIFIIEVDDQEIDIIDDECDATTSINIVLDDGAQLKWCNKTVHNKLVRDNIEHAIRTNGATAEVSNVVGSFNQKTALVRKLIEEANEWLTSNNAADRWSEYFDLVDVWQKLSSVMCSDMSPECEAEFEEALSRHLCKVGQLGTFEDFVFLKSVTV